MSKNKIIIDRLLAFFVDLILLYFLTYITSNIYNIIDITYSLRYVGTIQFFFVFYIIMPCIYFAYYQSKYGQTIGMMLFNLNIRDLDENKITFFKAFIRGFSFFLLYFITSLIIFVISIFSNENFKREYLDIIARFDYKYSPLFYISLALVFFNDKKMTLYDKIFKTYYIHTDIPIKKDFNFNQDLIFVNKFSESKLRIFFSNILDSLIILFIVFFLNYILNNVMNPDIYYLGDELTISVSNFLLLVTLGPLVYYYFQISKFQGTMGMFIFKRQKYDNQNTVEKNIIQSLTFTYVFIIVFEILILYFLN